jgi:hypothetical protein
MWVCADFLVGDAGIEPATLPCEGSTLSLSQSERVVVSHRDSRLDLDRGDNRLCVQFDEPEFTPGAKAPLPQH